MPDDRLSRMETLWSLVREAHKDPRGSGARFLGQLLERYRRPARQYLLGALRDEATAEELLQDFSLRFLRDDFWRADPANGRFRNFVNAVQPGTPKELRNREASAPLRGRSEPDLSLLNPG